MGGEGVGVEGLGGAGAGAKTSDYFDMSKRNAIDGSLVLCCSYCR